MGRGRWFAALVLVAAAMLALVLQVLLGGPDVLGGWQTAAARFGVAGAATVIGAVCVVLAVRQVRALEGEGLVWTVPALLLGPLLSVPLAVGADAGVGWADRHTAAWAAAEQQLKDLDALHPPLAPFDRPPASPSMAALLPEPSELGPDWYAGQFPAVQSFPLADASDAGQALMAKATHRASGGWDYERTLILRAGTFPSAALAAHVGQPVDGDTRRKVSYTESGARVTLLLGYGGLSTTSVRVQRGATLWTALMSPFDNRNGLVGEEESRRLATLLISKDDAP